MTNIFSLYFQLIERFLTQSMWRDEAFTALMIKKSYGEILHTTANDFNPPLYYFLMKTLSLLFIYADPIFLRMVSVFFLVFSAILIYLICKKVFTLSNYLSIFGVFVFLTSPVLLYYGFEARMYMMFVFFSILSFYLSFRKNFLFSFILLLGLHTHYYFMVVFFSFWLFELHQNKYKNLLAHSKLFLIPLFFSLPWFLYALPKSLTHSSNFWISPTNISDFPQILGVIYLGYEEVWNYFQSQILPISLLISLITLISFIAWKKNSKDQNSIFLFILSYGWAVVFFIVSLYKPLFVPRYLIFTSTFFLIYIFSTLKYFSKVQAFFILIIFFSINTSFNHESLKYKKKDDWQSSLKNIEKSASKNDNFYTLDATEYFTLCFYLPCDRVYIAEDMKNIPYYVGIALIPKEKIIGKLDSRSPPGIIIKSPHSYQVHPKK